MDDDGQHPAEMIFPMIDLLDEGWHMVYAQFPDMKESGSRQFLSFLSNASFSMLTKKPFRLRITSFFVLDRTGINILLNSRPAPFIGGTVFRKTRLVTGYEVHNRIRKSGSTNYSPKRLLKLWAELTYGVLFPDRTMRPPYEIADVLNAPPDSIRIVRE